MGREIVWSKDSRSIFEQFTVGLQEYTRQGEVPREADSDMQFSLELQQKRLTDKGLSMEYEFEPRGQFADKSGPGRSWSDTKYISMMEYRTCRLTRRFTRNGKKVHQDKDNMIMYQTITNANNQQLVGEDAYNCPDCGAITKVEELTKGCPYCGACFQMSDIFPKVTTYYFVKDSGYTEKEVKASVGKYMVICGIASLLYGLIYHYFFNSELAGDMTQVIVNGVFAGVVGGLLGGYFLWAIVHLGTMVCQAGKAVPMLSVVGASKKFVTAMQRYSAEFSYEYFSNKVVSMLKSIMYANAPEDLPLYVGEPLKDAFKDVVDIVFTGAVGFKAFQVTGPYCFVTTEVFLDVLRDGEGNIKEKREKYTVFVKKNITLPINYVFSIRHLECKSCGTSFDATKQKCCPSCQSLYDVADDDWVITRIIKK